MPENLYNKDHKATTPAYRDRYDNMEWIDYSKIEDNDKKKETRGLDSGN